MIANSVFYLFFVAPRLTDSRDEAETAKQPGSCLLPMGCQGFELTAIGFAKIQGSMLWNHFSRSFLKYVGLMNKAAERCLGTRPYSLAYTILYQESLRTPNLQGRNRMWSRNRMCQHLLACGRAGVNPASLVREVTFFPTLPGHCLLTHQNTLHIMSLALLLCEMESPVQHCRIKLPYLDPTRRL